MSASGRAQDAGPTSRFLTSQRHRLHYVDWGNPEAPPLLLVHGGRDHCSSWDWVAERLRHAWHVIAPDLRGHGDSQWVSDGTYTMAGYVFDLAELVAQQRLAPVTIVAHSLGGRISLRYAGIHPDAVQKLVVIEGLGLGPPPMAGGHDRNKMMAERMRSWIEAKRALASRTPRRYGSVDEAAARMREQFPRLSAEQAWHLTLRGVKQNEDGSFSWKFDNYVRVWPPYDMADAEVEQLWAAIACPTLLVHGKLSRQPSPLEDGKLQRFRNARAVAVEGAGHWVHHDRFEEFMALLGAFLQRA